MALHTITRKIDGRRYRYAALWTDEDFHNLPYIKEYGCLPSGWHAHHLSEAEVENKAPRVLKLAELPMRGASTNAKWDLRDALQERQRKEARPSAAGEALWKIGSTSGSSASTPASPAPHPSGRGPRASRVIARHGYGDDRRVLLGLDSRPVPQGC